MTKEEKSLFLLRGGIFISKGENKDGEFTIKQTDTTHTNRVRVTFIDKKVRNDAFKMLLTFPFVKAYE